MERLTISEVIGHCKRKVDHIEKTFRRSHLESENCGVADIIYKEYWEHRQVAEWLEELQAFKDKQEQGLLIELDSKDELIEVLAKLVLNSEFGRCYMCTNGMKNITLDGENNGCDGNCKQEEFTVDDLLKKIVTELKRNKARSEAEEALARMKGE